jgi:3-oxoacyl-[acyl-carrier-protein] synthase II
MSDPIAITGYGAVSPLGGDASALLAGLRAGRSGVAPITAFSTAGLETTFAASVPLSDEELAGGDRRQVRRKDRFVLLALRAAHEAMAHAGLSAKNWADPYRVAVQVGTGIGGIITLVREQDTLTTRGPDRVSPFLIPRMIGNMASGDIALALGAKGPTWTVMTACATGANAIHAAALLIRAGLVDIAIAGGCEAAIAPITIAGFTSAGALSRRNAAPQAASRPFDRGRDGFVIGEGAGVLILESLAHARARGAVIHALLAGCASTDDAHHETNPDPSGAALGMAIRLALGDAGLNPEAIAYINAHGTSTALNDATETIGLRQAFGSALDQVWVSSSKSMIGHTLGAAGALEAIATIAAVRDGILPPTINLDDPDPACALRHVANQTVVAPAAAALSINMGFGGHNGALVFTRA